MNFEELQTAFKKGLNQGRVLNPEKVFSLYSDKKIPLHEQEKFKKWHEKTTSFKSLFHYLEDPSLNEIIFHSPNLIQIDKGGPLKTVSLNHSSDYQLSLDILCLQKLIDWNYSKPYASFYLDIEESSFRATLIHFSCLSTPFSKLFLRKIKKNTFRPHDFKFNEKMAKTIIQEKKNIIVSGQTGGGKTTFLNCLLDLIPEEEHLVIFEETKELFRNTQTTTSFLSENNSNKSLVQYLTYALRMRPDRMILGEIRSKEAINFLLNMNTGHPGLMATIHANSANESLTRLAWLFCFYSEKEHFNYNQVLKMICKNIDYVFHIEEKKVKQMIKVLGSEDENPYFQEIKY
tara:strand:+ start:3177 stop:4214 length:1038 start_codon:yes stop_codon:yes gene_type:complete